MIGQQCKIVVATVAVLVLAVGATIGLLWLVTSWDGWVRIGSTNIKWSWQFVPVFIGLALVLVSWLWFVVSGFRAHWVWGLSILLLPVISLAFLFVYPQKGIRPLLIWVFGIMILLTIPLLS